jgi:hypothetical protein
METVMSKSLEQKPKSDGVDRRSFFRAGGGAAVVAAAAIVPGADAALAAESQAERTKPRYRETDHVKAFYRVNRY